MNGGEAVAEILRREGVEHVFCFPSNPLIDRAAAVGIRPLVGREERTVVDMANAYARVSRGARPAVCMVQAGPGAEHAFGAVAQAYADSVPVLVLPGGPPRERVGMRVNFDAVEAYRPITKWSARFDTAASVPDQLRRAFTRLRNGRPGPVLLEMPADVVDEALPEEAFAYEPPTRVRSAPDPARVPAVARRLLAAARPVIHAGQGVLWAEATAELVELAELLGAPVLTTFPGKSAFPETHPLSLGAAGVSVSPVADAVLPLADLVLSVGSSLLRTLGSSALPRTVELIQATNDPDDLAVEYPVGDALVGDARLVLSQLAEEVRRQRGEPRSGWDAGAAIRDAREAMEREWGPRFRSDETPINPLRVVGELMARLDPDETILTHDSGYPRDHLAPFYRSSVPHGYVGWGNSTPLGSSLGFALGAKLAAPDKVVVNVMGDAAFGQSGLDLETGVRNGIPTLCVLLNNSQMGNYEKMQPVAQERFDLKRLSGGYAEIARALGASAERIVDPGDVGPALEKSVAEVRAGSTVLLEVVTKAEPAFAAPGDWAR